MSWLPLIVALVAGQRLAELFLSRRNAERLRAGGAVEAGARHYPLFVLLHGTWLLCLLVLVPWERQPVWPFLLAYLLLQPLRVWAIASLGARWTTRILALPGAPLVRRGPYRWLRHPNYLIVALEIPLLPLAFGVWRVAVVFGALNLLLLGWRVRVENRALTPKQIKLVID